MNWLLVVCEISVIACAVVSGVFLTFSDFVMRSLDGVKTAAGIEVMQVINREVFKWAFMTLFLGMAAASVLILGYAYLNLTGTVGTLVSLAAGLYLVGVFGVTVVFNVPLNNKLRDLDFRSSEALDFWTSRYLPSWTFWNSVRAGASILGASLYLFAIMSAVQS